MQTVPVYEWTLGGEWFATGTQAETDYWTAEGVYPPELERGALVGHEDASEDDRRKLAWAA